MKFAVHARVAVMVTLDDVCVVLLQWPVQLVNRNPVAAWAVTDTTELAGNVPLQFVDVQLMGGKVETLPPPAGLIATLSG